MYLVKQHSQNWIFKWISNFPQKCKKTAQTHSVDFKTQIKKEITENSYGQFLHSAVICLETDC